MEQFKRLFSRKKIQSTIKSKNIEIKRLKEELDKKKREIHVQSKILLEQEQKLTEYISKIFEQQERERIVKWIVNNSRATLDLEKVMSSIVFELGRLLKVDRCIMSLLTTDHQEFYIQSEYKINDNITSLANNHILLHLFNDWQEYLLIQKKSIVINDIEKEIQDEEKKIYFRFHEIKSIAIIPLIHEEKLLGILRLHKTTAPEKWQENHLEIINDISMQIAIAIQQASLYRQLKKATKLKSEFLASMSHEIRTPLNAVIGFSEMLNTNNYGELSKKQKEYLNNITISGKHLLQLINNILDLSKIESGNMELKYEIFDSCFVINEIISSLKSMAIKKCISIDFLPIKNVMEADLTRFRQIIYNLLSNALKFTGENGKIQIKSTIKDNYFEFEIEDNGIGISQKGKEKIFEQFTQVDSSYTRKQEGSGLGLAITKKLIELHRGSISFESEIDKGTIFRFKIPISAPKTSLG